jgi:molybdate transport system substrate-binding protein
MRKLFLLLVLLISAACAAEELSVAAAADLNFALKEIAQRYHVDTGDTLKLSFGSSGNFFVQLQNGAPFDVFLSADIAYPEKLAQAGLADPQTLSPYAVGKIVLWVPKASKLDLKKGMAVLLDPSISKLAIANPAHAPYGRAAEEALKKSDLHGRVQSKLVLGENIAQAAQFVQTGNAEIGIIAESLALSPAMKEAGRFVEVPENLYAPIRQGAVVLKSSPHTNAAKAFLDYLKRPAAQQIMEKYGFSLPRP